MISSLNLVSTFAVFATLSSLSFCSTILPKGSRLISDVQGKLRDFSASLDKTLVYHSTVLEALKMNRSNYSNISYGDVYVILKTVDENLSDYPSWIKALPYLEVALAELKEIKNKCSDDEEVAEASEDIRHGDRGLSLPDVEGKKKRIDTTGKPDGKSKKKTNDKDGKGTSLVFRIFLAFIAALILGALVAFGYSWYFDVEFSEESIVEESTLEEGIFAV